MARYWVGGTGTWNGTAGVKWSATSGGAGGAAVPAATDDVFFDAASGSGTVTVSGATAECKNLNFTGFTGTFKTVFSMEISGNLTLGAAMTIDQTSGGLWSFISSGAQTATFNGKSIGKVFLTEDGTGSLTFQDNLISASANIQLQRGTLDFNNTDVTVSICSIAPLNGAGTWNGGSGTLSCEVFSADSTSQALTASSSNLNIVIQTGTNVAGNFSGSFIGSFSSLGQAYTYKTLIAGHLTDCQFITDDAAANTTTVTDFTLQPISATADGVYTFFGGFNIICSGTFTANGVGTGNETVIQGGNTISAAVAAASYVNVTDSVATGAGIPFVDFPGGIDGGGNVNWQFTGATPTATILARPMYF